MWKKCGRQKNNDCTLVRGVELYTRIYIYIYLYATQNHQIIFKYASYTYKKIILLKLLLNGFMCAYFLFHKVCNKLRGVYYLRKRRENESMLM